MKRWPLLALAAALGASRLWFRAPWWEFAGPLFLGIASAIHLAALPRNQRLGWAFLLSTVAALSSFAMAGMPAYGFLVLVPWLLWVLFFVLPLVLIPWRDHSWQTRTMMVLSLITFFYLGSATLVFDFSQPEYCYDQETPDRWGRLPSIGPNISWVGRTVCNPDGPCFLFSCDYTGQEWIWRAYRPLVRLWFALPSCPGYAGLDP